MSEVVRKRINRQQRAARTRAAINGTADRPRLSVHISNKNVSAQIINDQEGKTLASASSLKMKDKASLTEKATSVGTEIAKQAKANKIKRVVMDRGAKKYHGRVKALADAARENGLEF